MQKFDEVHFFIAESGSFDNSRDIILIGGLLLFGQYDETIQNKLRDAMVDSLNEIGKKYPHDTFFHNFLESDETKRQGKLFAAALAKKLESLTPNEDERIIYCIVMFQHLHDIHANAPTLLAQLELNNRYVSMLCSLVEHALFVSERTSKKLNDDAKFHIHAAARSYAIELDKASLEFAKSLKLNLKKSSDSNKKNTYIVTSPLDADGLKNIFNISIRNRWSNAKFELGSVETAELALDKKIKKSDETSPAIYLANTILGIERARLIRSQLIADQTLPILESLIYDQNLDSTAICKSNYCNGNIESLISTIELHPIDPNSQQNQELVRILIKEYTRDSKQFQRLFETAKSIIDNPKNRKYGNDLLRLIEHIYRMSGKQDLFADFYLTLIQFSVANQVGNISKANEMWKTYMPMENSLPKLGLEHGLKIGTEFRCRRAINLMEQFNFDLAEQVMIEIGTREEGFSEAMAKFFSVPVEQVNLQNIGRCYDTLAQVFAFQAADPYNRKLSELFFRKALATYNDPVDQVSVWVHLGHLACDFPNQLRPLWDEVGKNLPTTGNLLDDGIKTPFVVAVKLKGALVFGNAEQKKNLTETMDGITRSYAYEVLNSFPYGLILQTLAMLNTEIGNKKRANKLYEKAIRSLELGEQFSRLLSIVAKIRHSLFTLDSNPPVQNNPKGKYLFHNVRQFIALLPKSQITKQYNDSTYYVDQKSLQQYAKRILDNIKFIHW